jgi:hypothetical protein
MQPYAPSHDPTAVLGRRFAALAIDLLFLGVVGVVLLAIASHHSYYDAPANACSQIARSGSSLCLRISDRVYVWNGDAYRRAVLLGLVAGFLDLVVLQTLTGASVGKLCVGLRVIEQPGNEARFLRVVGRWLFLIVDLGCFVVGLVTTLATRPHRRVGDIVCGTYVVGVGSVGIPVGVPDPLTPVQSTTPSAYAAPPGAPVPPGWGSPTGWATVPAPAPVATPPGTSPTTPGEWGAVARPGPALIRSPHWEAPPDDDDAAAAPPPPEVAPPPTPVERDMAPQWATPPRPTPAEADEPQPAAAEPMHAPEAASESLAAVPQWSPIVPLTTKDGARADGATEIVGPPPPPPAPWRASPPASPDGEPEREPAPVPPAEPPPPPPTEPPPPPPAADTDEEPDVAEPDAGDDVPWWDANA